MEGGSSAFQIGDAPLGPFEGAAAPAGHAKVGQLGLAGGELRPQRRELGGEGAQLRAVPGDPVEVEVGHQASSVKARWRACTSTWTGFWNSASATVAPSAGTGCSPFDTANCRRSSTVNGVAAAIPVSGQAAWRHAVSPPAGRDSSRPKRGSVICSWIAKNQPSPCRRSSSTRSKPKKADVGVEEAGEDRPLHHRLVAARRARPAGGDGQHDRVRVAPQQLAADQQHEVGLAAGDVDERSVGRPLVHRGDVGGARAAEPIPEPADRRAALVGGVPAPQQLAVELVVDAGEVGRHEPGVRLEQRDGVGRDGVDPGQQPRAVVACEQPVGRARRAPGRP